MSFQENINEGRKRMCLCVKILFFTTENHHEGSEDDEEEEEKEL